MTNFNRALLKTHPKAAYGIRIIEECILDFIQEKKTATFAEIEHHVGLQKISLDIVVNLLKILMDEKLITITNARVMANKDAIAIYKKKNSVLVPKKHHRIWSDEEYVDLALMKMNQNEIGKIAKFLGRTVQSVNMQLCMLRKAVALMPLIEKNEIMKKFLTE